MVVFTICSKNYLPQASILARSLRAAEPGIRFVIFLADELVDPALGEKLGLEIVEARALAIPTFYDMALRYSILEFNTAIKPSCFLYAFDKLGVQRALYLDPDVWVLRPLEHVHAALDAGASLVLTPHILRPLDSGFLPDNRRILQTGAFNLGFAAFARTQEARDFIGWWGSELVAGCRVDLAAGIFVDQKYFGLATSFLDHVKVLRHPGYNVAYWNLAQRPLTRTSGGDWLAAGEPLSFAHFSGLTVEDEEVVSVHQNRLTRSDLGEGAELFDVYRGMLQDEAARLAPLLQDTSYAYGVFSDGTPIPAWCRSVYADHIAPSEEPYERVFDPAHPIYAEGSDKVAAEGRAYVSHVMYALWAATPRLMAAFDLRRGADCRAYGRWFAKVGAAELGVPMRYAPPGLSALARGAGRIEALSWSIFARAQAIKRKAHLFPKPVRRFGLSLNRAALRLLARGETRS